MQGWFLFTSGLAGALPVTEPTPPQAPWWIFRVNELVSLGALLLTPDNPQFFLCLWLMPLICCMGALREPSSSPLLLKESIAPGPGASGITQVLLRNKCRTHGCRIRICIKILRWSGCPLSLRSAGLARMPPEVRDLWQCGFYRVV